MTERNAKNREVYLDLCKTVWDMDDESLEYISNRTSDSWEVLEEFKPILNIPNSTYEDQRVRINLDLSSSLVLDTFSKDDDSFKLFQSYFQRALECLKEHYSCQIGYKEFIENKVLFNKNPTKLKKVLAVVYKDYPDIFKQDSDIDFDEKACSEWIVKKFERIGASKKSFKKVQLVISFNPIDWLMCSTSENWQSCLSINHSESGYKFCLGLPFLCGDRNRILVYVTDGSKKECMGMEVDHFETRTWCLLDTNNNYNVVKWYPNGTVGTKAVAAITGLNFQKNTDFKQSKYPIDVLTTRKGITMNIYSDMGTLTPKDGKLWNIGNSVGEQQIFTKNLINITQKPSTFVLDIKRLSKIGIKENYRIPEWKKVGMHLDYFATTLKCNCCSEDKVGFVLSNTNSFYCYDCYKQKIFYCSSCRKECDLSEGKHTITTDNGETVEVCEKCFSTLHSCKFCNCYSLKSTLNQAEDGSYICNNCLQRESNPYKRCDACNKITNSIVIGYNTFTKKRQNKCKKCQEISTTRVSIFGRHHMIIFKEKIGGLDIE